MTRRLLIPLLGSGLLLAASSAGALGKCENPEAPADCEVVMASVDFGATGTVRAGSETLVTIAVSRGERPFEAAGVALVFTHLADDAVVSVDARESGEPGQWLAEVELPAGGVWSLVADVDGTDAVLQNVGLLRVREPLPPPVAPPVTPTAPVLPIALLLAGIAAAALLGRAIRDRSRRPRAAASPAALDRS